MVKQKFHRGDRVRVARDLGPTMSHFSGKGCEALIVGSYVDLCYSHSQGAERDYKIYEILIFPEHCGRPHTSCWYNEDQLTKIPGPHGNKVLNGFLQIPFG